MKDINIRVSELEFEDYLEMLVGRVKKKLGEKTKVVPVSVVKNNGKVRKGLYVDENINNINPNIYLEGIYENQKNKGMVLEQAVDEFLFLYESAKCNDFPENCLEWENIKGGIVTGIINAEWNRELLENIPHTKVLDLAIVYRAVLEIAGDDIASVLIRNEHLEAWGITKEILDKTAQSNMETLFRAELFPMNQILMEIFGESKRAVNILDEDAENIEEDMMYVLTNKYQTFGAATLFHEGVMERIGELVKTDYFVIPSSIHEFLILKDTGNYTGDEITEMIKEVNKTVDKEKWLSEHYYHYSVETKCFC